MARPGPGVRLSTWIALVASVLTLLFVLTVGMTSYFVTRTQIIQGIEGTLDNHASLLAGRLSSTLSSVVNTLSPLRQNALVLNSLMDSLTRNTSLQPFLQDFSTVNGVPVEIALTDFEGKTIAGARPITDMTIHWRKAVLDDGVPHVSIERSSSSVYLFIAEPVFYMRTLSPEGALIYGIDLTQLVADFNAAGGAELVRLMQHGEPVLNDQQAEDSKQQARPMLTQTHPLDLPGLLAPLGLSVELSTDPEAMTRPLHELTLVYVYLGLAVLGAVTVLSTIAARRIARPLWELEHVAAAVVTSGSLDHRFRGGGYTEVARLGQTFNKMLERLGEAYTASEQQATAARRSEQRYRSIFDTTTAAILELDIDPILKALAALRQAGITDLPAYLTGHPELLRGTARDVLIVDGNHAALEMFEASDPDDLCGPLERMLLPESYAMLHALAMAVEEGLGSLGMEMALSSLGGATRHVMLGAHVPNRLTQPAPILLSLVDISSRKAVERELLRTNNMLHAVGDALNAYITGGEHPESEPFDNLLTKLLESTDSEYGFVGEIHHSGDGRPYLRTHAITNIAWNEESRRLFDNRGPGGMEFTNLSTLFGAVMTTQQPVIANHPRQDPRAGGLPPGHPPLNAFLGIPFISDNKMVGMAGVANRPGGYDDSQLDLLRPLITACTGLTLAIRSDRKRLQYERELREEQQRLNTVLETAPLILWALDREGKFLLSRGKGLVALGLAKDEVVGKSVFDMYRDAPEVIVSVRRALAGERVHTPSQVAGRWFDVRYEPITDDNGNLLGCVGAALDVTDRVHADQDLARYRLALEKQVRERTEAYEEIKRYAYIFSHDLRGPLVSAKGFVGELRLDIGELRESVTGLLEGMAQAEGEHLRELTQTTIPEALGFIEASVDKIDTLTSALLSLSRVGSREFQFETVDMQALLSETLDALAFPIDRAGIQVELGELPPLWADRSGVTQVLDNLLRNAIDYQRPGVQGWIAVAGKHDDGETVYSVRDNGIGIAKDDLARVFEPFRRAAAHSTPGEGMGLTFVQTLVRRMGGRIWCESELSVGSTFSFAIPDRSDREIDELPAKHEGYPDDLVEVADRNSPHDD